MAVVDTASLFADVEPASSRRLLQAALDAFAAQGYRATTTRDIAQRAGLSPAGVYVHFGSKADLLGAISRVGHDTILRVCEQAIAQGEDPGDRLSRFVRTFAAWHAAHHGVARVIQYELRELTPAAFEEARERRRRFDQIVQAELRRGNETGMFAVGDVAGTALAILSLCIDVARWYGAAPRRSPAAIGDLYAELVLRMVRSGGELGEDA
jgi:AcrR family transcriptional regulator